ncbi:MAG: hypothetical protein ABI266_01250 [Ginsengibacter sp.]
MKRISLASIMSILVISSFSCNSQNKTVAEKQAGDIQKMVKANSPGYMSTSNEYYMKAKINGKEWVADEIMASDNAGRMIGKKNGELIGFPFELRYTKTGAKTNFKDDAVDIFMNDDVKIWGGHIGEMVFTAVGDNYAEGKFYLTGTSSDSNKQLAITEGVFRIPLTNK